MSVSIELCDLGGTSISRSFFSALCTTDNAQSEQQAFIFAFTFCVSEPKSATGFESIAPVEAATSMFQALRPYQHCQVLAPRNNR